ncbi:hypothetical protein FB451DRAFT_1564320 [Mycena latifolia]|nr:hypothetical protein FB451DRAFT_1564320 [Mycena latifolia]
MTDCDSGIADSTNMFSFYPSYRPQPSPYYQPSPYARALAQQQEQQRARALAQEMERQRAARSRYFPNGYDYEPDSDEEDYYLTPRQRAILEARRRQEVVEQRNQEAARMLRERSMKQQQTRAAETQSTPTPQSPPRRSVSPSAEKPKHTESPATSPSPQPSPSASPELLNEAATKIQTQYRIHRSFHAISELASKFETLKASFVPPTTIDFQGGEGSIVSVPVPSTSTHPPAENAKLAFTSTNVPLHTYAEHLSRLLVALDAVESRGDRGVREQRRGLARAIEGEAERFEAFWRGVWAAYQEQQQRVDEEEVCAMVVDEEPEVAAPLPELAAPESDSDVEPEPELPTPPATPAESPNLVLSPESDAEEDGVVVKVAEDEKVSGEDFVMV